MISKGAGTNPAPRLRFPDNRPLRRVLLQIEKDGDERIAEDISDVL